MPKAANTIYLKDYQSPSYSIENLFLNFDLYNDHALITNEMTIKKEREGSLVLNGDELELISLHMDGRALLEGDYRLVGSDLVIDNCPDRCVIKVVTKIRPQENYHLSGLYRSNHLFCTQCEAEGFRRITYFPDRPDVLTFYTIRITADKTDYPILLSNGNLIDQGDGDDGRHWVIWRDPFKKPSYLFALVAGKLVCIKDSFKTCSGKEVDLRIYVEPGNEDKCSHAMASLKKAMKWDEEVYGREYDLDIFMIVAVNDFNMGAMENKGLNIFNSKFILARPDIATDHDFSEIESVVGHEYFHNWTGNRVTCRDWFQLSLKEGLTVFRDQEFSRDMNSPDVNRILDVKALRIAQFPEDAGSMAHPVRPESYQEINNFYTATVYNKGAEVIRMQQTLLGKDGFRKGMDLYFQRHDGQAVTINDFIAAMEDANQVDFTQFKRWYNQAGTPEIKVESSFDKGNLTLTLHQTCPPTPDAKEKKPFHIPIRAALFDETGYQIPLEKPVLELKEATQTFTFSGLKSKPYISLLREFSAPVKLQREVSDEELMALLRFENDGFSKWDIAQKLAIDTIKGFLKMKKETWAISESLMNTFRHVLKDESLDASLRGELLTPPDFEEVAADLSLVDVDAIVEAGSFYQKALGKGLFETLKQTYDALWQQEKHEMHAQAYAHRKLRNLCLSLMMKADEEKTLAICQGQFDKAKTMTDQQACFALLANAKDPNIVEQASNRFYQQWAKDELVIDKWFTILATSESPTVLEKIRSLLKHPAFSIKNPNKVRALIGAFCMRNHRYFHALDGSGYTFLYDMIVEIDKFNSQVAARLATPFTRWTRYDKPRQVLMLKALKQLSQLGLSPDLREIVSKSLEMNGGNALG